MNGTIYGLVSGLVLYSRAKSRLFNTFFCASFIKEVLKFTDQIITDRHTSGLNRTKDGKFGVICFR